jgi:nucleotide-binding universal stress UspA family protein
VYDSMLVSLDGSEIAAAILPYATELAKRCASHVTLIRVVESMAQAMATLAPAEPMAATPQAIENVSEGIEAEEAAARAYLSHEATQLSAAGLQVDWIVVSGPAGAAIVRYAEEKSINLIAMSSHGRGGIGRAIFGSTADHVVQHTSSPVLILPHHEKK